MSANLDLVRSIYAAWERGDWTSAEWAHPEIEFVVPDGPSPGSWTGLANVAQALAEGLRTLQEVRVEADEFREIDNERVLVFAHYCGRGKASGLEIEQIGAGGAHLLHLRGGKVTRLVAYWDRERALSDLGLAPHTRT
jgi:ketosteroid isomerase-like protein